MRQCRRFVLLLSVFTALSCAQDAGREIQLGIATLQDSPHAKITGATSTTDMMYREVVLKNVSSEPIVAVTFGALLSSTKAAFSKAEPRLVRSDRIRTAIAPGEEESLKVLLGTPSSLFEKTKDWGGEIVADLGILSVELADGTRWDFDPQAKGSFKL